MKRRGFVPCKITTSIKQSVWIYHEKTNPFTVNNIYLFFLIRAEY